MPVFEWVSFAKNVLKRLKASSVTTDYVARWDQISMVQVRFGRCNRFKDKSPEAVLINRFEGKSRTANRVIFSKAREELYGGTLINKPGHINIDACLNYSTLNLDCVSSNFFRSVLSGNLPALRRPADDAVLRARNLIENCARFACKDSAVHSCRSCLLRILRGSAR